MLNFLLLTPPLYCNNKWSHIAKSYYLYEMKDLLQNGVDLSESKKDPMVGIINIIKYVELYY